MAKGASQRGRRKGPTRIGILLRLVPELKSDLEVLREVLEGQPPLNSLVVEAVRQYVARKLEDPRIREEYDRRLKPSLRVISSHKRHSHKGEG